MAEQQTRQPENAGNWVIRLVKGALIGAGAILPGISGGALCVALHLYTPILQFLAHPLQGLKRSIRFFLPVGVGFALGVLLLSRVVAWLFRQSEAPAVWLFIGLIVGTVPSLFREAGLRGRGRGAWIALGAGFAGMMALLLLLRQGGVAHVTPSFGIWVLCGVLWGIGIIVPGMSPSSLFIFMGIYEPMSAAIGALDFGVILPMALGLIVTAAGLARGMRRLLDIAYPALMHAILGIVLASTVMIVPLSAPMGALDILLYVGCFAVGCVGALLMTRVGGEESA